MTADKLSDRVVHEHRHERERLRRRAGRPAATKRDDRQAASAQHPRQMSEPRSVPLEPKRTYAASPGRTHVFGARSESGLVLPRLGRHRWRVRGWPTAGGGDVDQLLRSDEPGRRRWLDRRKPVPPEANWWLHLLVLLEQRREQRPAERVAWVELTVWLLVQARERGALGRDEVAQRLAYFVALVRGTQVAGAVLPSADAVVRECLDAVPISLVEAAVLTDQPDSLALTRLQMLELRRAKNLINAAERHLHDVEDAQLAERLRAWMAIRPRLT